MGSNDSGPSDDLDTRGRLVAAGRQVLESQGYSALSLRAVAKLANLSATAPYKHFPDGFPELLATIAIGGFVDLIAVLEKAFKAAHSQERIVELALRYVRFGVERPELYRAMFSPQVAKQVEMHETMFTEGEISFESRNTYRELAAIRLRAFDAIVAPLRDGVATGALRQDDPEDFGLALAAMVHGLVGQFIDEGLGIRLSQKQPWSKARQQMSRRIVDILLVGMNQPLPVNLERL